MANYRYTITLQHPTRNLVVGADKWSKAAAFALAVYRCIAGGVPGKTPPKAWLGTAAASGTVTFSAAAAVNDTVTINGVAFTAKELCARGTAAFASIVADNTLTVNGVTFTAKASPTAGSLTEFALGANDAAAAANCAAKINAHPTTSLVVQCAVLSGSTVTIKAIAEGTSGNAITLAKVGAPITISGATLSGGTAAVGNQFDYGLAGASAAASLYYAVLNSSTAKIAGVVTAETASNVTTLKAIPLGQIGNLCTLAKSGATIAVSGANFTGGTQEDEFVF